jgi:hypothetical protein
MLFSRLYNWIKYKTLPPSVLFLNRLFVERDSKHRRVTSNLGLTFRNSKWSTYARSNINLSSRMSYITTLLKILSVIVFIIAFANFSKYYYTDSFNSLVYTVFWFLSDADIYLKLVFSSSLIYSFQSFISFTLNRLFNYDLNSSSYGTHISSASQELSIPKRLHKPVFYSWLINKPNGLSYENLFQPTNVSSSVVTKSEVFTNLFKLTHNVGLASIDTCSGSLLGETSTVGSNNSKFWLQQLEQSLYSNSATSTTSSFNELNKWSLANIAIEDNLNGNLGKNISGLFYETSTSYSELAQRSLLFPEASLIRNSVNNQLSVIQWNRWLYKYNLLHRSLLKTASSITFTKRLISTGFYSSSLSTRNIWASSAITSSKLDNSSFANLSRTLYGDLNKLGNVSETSLRSSQSFLNSNSITSLKFYELSYYWFIKRFYIWNTLDSNSIKATRSLQNNLLPQLQSSLQEYQTSNLRFTSDLSQAYVLPSSSLDVDLHLSYTDLSLLSKGKIETIANIASNTSVGSVTFYAPSKLS